MARIERVRIYPVKALPGTDVDAARITAAGTLAGDREYAMFDGEGDVVNGKRTARVHDLSAAFDRGTRTLTLEAADRADGDARSFSLPGERAAAEAWLGERFDVDLDLRRDGEAGFPDRPNAGPSVLSTATLETVAGWYDDVTVDGLRRRLRANVEISGVEPFWEDRFVGADAPAMRAGEVRLEGVEPCGRCVVPERDPDTGTHDPAFRERFVRRRRETFPSFADADAFEHYYAVSLIARVPEDSRGEVLRPGDPVEVAE